MNEEEKKAIEILKEIEINTYAEGKAIAIDTVLKLIKKLQKENEELKNQEATQRKINELLVQRYSNSISVQKVKDKISERQFELQQEYKDFEDDSILLVLQELLEGRK